MDRIKEIHIYQYDLPVVGPSYRMALFSSNKVGYNSFENRL